jgi:hypothetical protein
MRPSRSCSRRVAGGSLPGRGHRRRRLRRAAKRRGHPVDQAEAVARFHPEAVHRRRIVAAAAAVIRRHQASARKTPMHAESGLPSSLNSWIGRGEKNRAHFSYA